jgi:hypothetical protein
MIPTPEVQTKLAEYRQKSLENTITLEEMKDAIRLMRAQRMMAASTAKKPSAARAPARSADELLSEFEGL